MACIPKQLLPLLTLLLVVNDVHSDCTSGSDGVSFTCEDSFAGQSVSLSVDADTCRDEPKITVELSIDALGIDWKETFDNSQEVPIPGFSYGLFGVNLKIEINSDTDGYTMLKLILTVHAFAIKVTDLTILNERIAKSDCNGLLYWWNLVGAGGLVVIILLMICCCCCCCCCCCRCCKKENSSGGQVIMVAPAQRSNNVMVSNTAIQMHNFPPSYASPSSTPYQNVGNTQRAAH